MRSGAGVQCLNRGVAVHKLNKEVKIHFQGGLTNGIHFPCGPKGIGEFGLPTPVEMDWPHALHCIPCCRA
jgi:hypothetical protein